MRALAGRRGRDRNARDRARRCASLILADTFAGHPDGAAIYQRSLAASADLRALAEARVDALLAPAALADVRTEVIETMARIDPAAYRIGAEAVWLADQSDRAAAIDVPTLVVVGEEDRVTPPELSQELAALIPGAASRPSPAPATSPTSSARRHSTLTSRISSPPWRAMGTAYIVDAVRTAGGRRGGALKDWHPADLGAAVLDALVERTGIDPAAIDDVIVGCVSQIGEQSCHVGRSMVLASCLPDSVPAVTIDRQCGSSQQSVHFAAQAVMSGTQDLVIAAGVESMTRVPMGTPVFLPLQAGIGTGPWPQSVQDRYGVSEFTQFRGAEMMASKYGFSRDDLDAFALDSHRKAAAATQAGAFDSEIVQVGDHRSDEGIRYDASPKISPG